MKRIATTLRSKQWIALALAALMLPAVGCQSFTDSGSKKKKKDSSWFSFKKKEYQIPQSMNVTWTNDILTLPGKQPTRGFGGRFYFYNEKTQAIPVDGELMVYGFDDTHHGRSHDDLQQADKRFRFTAEQFTSHFSESELGASYSVWIPWDEANSPAKKVMLIATFLTKDGRLVRGMAASLSLPGREENPNEGMIQQTSYTVPTSLPGQLPKATNAQGTKPNSGLRTTTIQLPPGALRHSSPGTGETPIANIPVNPSTAYNTVVMENLGAPPQGISPNLAARMQNSIYQNDAIAIANLSAQANSLPTQPNQSTTPAANQPQSIPFGQPVTHTTPTNGWALPEFAPTNWSSLSPRSSHGQPLAPASPTVQQISYPPR